MARNKISVRIYEQDLIRKIEGFQYKNIKQRIEQDYHHYNYTYDFCFGFFHTQIKPYCSNNEEIPFDLILAGCEKLYIYLATWGMIRPSSDLKKKKNNLRGNYPIIKITQVQIL